MPSAGLYPIHTDKITFARDGRWYADGEPVLHPRLANLFSRYLRRKPEGGFEIWIDERFHSDVEVEDTPWVVIRADCGANGRVEIELNDGSHEELADQGLTVGSDDALYCRIKGGSERARFLRSAQSSLAGRIEETTSGFQLRCGHTIYPIDRD